MTEHFPPDRLFIHVELDLVIQPHISDGADRDSALLSSRLTIDSHILLPMKSERSNWILDAQSSHRNARTIASLSL